MSVRRLGLMVAAFSTLSLLAASSGAAPIVGFTADINDTRGQAADNGGLNIGHTFTVTGQGIQVTDLGVYDFHGDGLLASHTVTLFSDTNNNSTHTPLGSVTVPSGTAAPLSSGFRLTSLAAPLALAPGNYSVIAYQLNGSGVSDEYGEPTNNGFNGSPNVSSTGFTPFSFTSNQSPSYPSDQSAGSNLASASFAYNNVPEPASVGLLLGLGGLALLVRRRA